MHTHTSSKTRSETGNSSPQTHDRSTQSQAPWAAQLLQMQKKLGNRATTQFLSSHLQPIQRITEQEVTEIETWWDKWLDRAIQIGYIKADQKAELFQRGQQLILSAKGNAKKDKIEVQKSLDHMLRELVPSANTDGDKIPIEFRVPQD